MSSILEALRKLEEEKNARRGGTGNITGKITAAGRRARQRPPWLMPAAMAAVAAVAVLATYAVMGGFSARHGGTVAVRAAEPAATPLVIPPLQTAAQSGMNSASPQIPLRAPGMAGTDTGGAVRAPLVALPAEKHSFPPQTPQHESVPDEAVPPPSPISGSHLPELNVTGIAWQRDNTSRLAVVNGVSLVEGAEIEGARVKEIFPDRVLFSFNKKEFEVALGNGPP